MALHALLLFAMPLLADRVSTVIRDLENLQGTWVFTAEEEKGEKCPVPLGWGSKYMFKRSTYTIPAWLDEEERHTERGAVRINPLTNPKEITMYNGRTRRLVTSGIYELDGNRLKICLAYPRPKEFDSSKTANGCSTCAGRRRSMRCSK
jgi:uncharacterized protein (TIGR03067 family)